MSLRPRLASFCNCLKKPATVIFSLKSSPSRRKTPPSRWMPDFEIIEDVGDSQVVEIVDDPELIELVEDAEPVEEVEDAEIIEIVDDAEIVEEVSSPPKKKQKA